MICREGKEAACRTPEHAADAKRWATLPVTAPQRRRMAGVAVGEFLRVEVDVGVVELLAPKWLVTIVDKLVI